MLPPTAFGAQHEDAGFVRQHDDGGFGAQHDDGLAGRIQGKKLTLMVFEMGNKLCY